MYFKPPVNAAAQFIEVDRPAKCHSSCEIGSPYIFASQNFVKRNIICMVPVNIIFNNYIIASSIDVARI